MKSWYPLQARVDILTAELRRLEQIAEQFASSLDSCLPAISESLNAAMRMAAFPKRQISQWVWVASQFRLSVAQNPIVTLKAGAALLFLGQRVSSELNETDVQDLNWVLETTVHALADALPPDALRVCLSGDELRRVESRLAELQSPSDFDEAKVRRAVERQTATLVALSTSRHLSTLNSKVNALFLAASKPGSAGQAARAALLYLAEEHDVVSDSAGFLGLLDDVYVIEWAYALVENQTRCLPLLRGLVQSYPFVADLALVGDPIQPLDQYSQYVTCAALESLFQLADPGLLVLRESGPHGLICAFFAAVQAARLHSLDPGSEVATWDIGSPITLGDGTELFKATYLGAADMGGRPMYRIGVRGNGSLLVPTDLLPYMAKSPSPHKRLSTGNEISSWRKARHVDPLVFLTGSTRKKLEHQESVLLLGPRSKLEEFHDCLTPLGSSPAALLGVRYVSSENRVEDLAGSSTDNPYIYACSDPDTAYELIRRRPSHVAKWRVVVDGARAASALLSSLRTDGEGDIPPLCILAELHDRESTSELISQRAKVWYLEDQDVEMPPLIPARVQPGVDAVARALARHANHWTTARRIHETRNDFLEAVAKWTQTSVASENNDDRRGLELAVSDFLQRCIAEPFQSLATDRAVLQKARAVATQASVLRQYDHLAAELFELFEPALKDVQPIYGRSSELIDLANSIAGSESVAIVCRSARIAEECRIASEHIPVLREFSWMNVESLRRTAPYDRVIVAGWLDRFSMRELATCGYGAQIDMILLPFERRWFDATIAANHAWERRIEQKTIQQLQAVAEKLEGRLAGGRLWREQMTARLELRNTASLEPLIQPHDDEIPEFEKIEARAIESLYRTTAAGREQHVTSRAQLVLFEEPGAYAYLAPGGKVIVLSGQGGLTQSSASTPGDAERMLFKSVGALQAGDLLALPLSNDRDLIDARADHFLEKPAHVRQVASLWKLAIRRYLERSHGDAVAFARRMKEAGCPRDATTIRSWATSSHTVAPRNYRDTIPILAELTSDSELKGKASEILSAIDMIYRARGLAAEAIVRELFAGSIDLDAEELTFELAGSHVRYALRRVRRLEAICEVPLDMIGRARHMVEVSGRIC